MRCTNSGFSIADFLIIMAILMIAVGLFGPMAAKRLNKSSPAASHAAVVQPTP